jgi:hypothetical protein
MHGNGPVPRARLWVCVALAVSSLEVSSHAGAAVRKVSSPRTVAATGQTRQMAGSTQIPCSLCTDPIEPIWREVATQTRVKSPAQHMRFTARTPLRLLADALDLNAGLCPPGHPPYVCPGVEERFYVDAALVGTVPPNPDDYNLWELRLPNGLLEGDHVLTVKYVPYNPSTHGGGTPIDGSVPVTIHIDPAPVHGGTVTLTHNLVLSGSTDLNWTDKTVIGNGFTVTSADGYAGHVIVEGSNVTGLGSFTAVGIDLSTSASISIQHSIFEATGAMRFGAEGHATLTVKDNELRANNMVTYEASDPSVPVMLELVGNTSGARVVQGNRVGAGMLRINGGNGWQIGGLNAGEGNVLIGARAVLDLVNSSHDTIQGNYLHHDYHGGFSQGFCLWLEGTSDHELVEHNVIRGGSWPVQSFGGEFRYNLVIDSGHDFWRSATDNTQIHHNVFANASGPNTGYGGAILVYGGESGLNIDNNTFDAGGAIGQFDAPALTIGSGSLFASIRNNLFMGFSDVNGFGRAFVSTDEASVSSPRVTSADYNAWFNPLASHSVHYRPGIVANTPGTHDVQTDPKLSGDSETPYRIAESCIWIGTCTIKQILAHYREVYRPATGSPLIGGGDPAAGAGTAIGAVGPDDTNPADLFGRVQPLTTGPPPTAITYYLSEGATGSFFDEDVLLANPADQAAPVTLTFAKEDGEQVVATRSLPPQSHLTVHVDTIPGLEATAASAQVRSDAGLPLIVERTMFWDQSHYAGSTGSAVDRPAQDWFFAEGSQGFFQTFVLVINPNATPADVTFTFQRETGAPVQKTATLGAATRLTLDTGSIPDLVNQSFGIAVHATQPIMVERSMYFGSIFDGATLTRLWSGGTESAGVTAPSTHWFLAEGATGGFFTTFILLSNPQTTSAHVDLQYLLDTGETVTVPKTIPANARLTTNVGGEADVRLHNAAVSTVVTSDVPIIAERSMYWPGAAVPWGEGHNSFGVVDAGTKWGLSEGRAGGPLNFHTYILLANPQTTAATVTVRYLRDAGAPIVRTYTVSPTSRFNIDVNTIDELRDSSFGAVIEVTNDVPIIVERSLYWDWQGISFSGGTNVTGSRLP